MFSCFNAVVNGSIGLRISVASPLTLDFSPVRLMIGITNLNVTPDSPQSKISVRDCGFPWLRTDCSELDPEISAPRAIIALAVASVSLQNSGLMIFVVPADRRAVKKARCVWAFDGGAVILPRTRLGIILTFKVSRSPLPSRN